MGHQKQKIYGQDESEVKQKKSKKPHSEEEMREVIKEAKQEKQDEQDKPQEPKETKVQPKLGKKKARSKKYQESLKLVDRNKLYSIDQAIELVKKTSYTKFDGSVEFHIKVLTKKGQDAVRTLVSLPAGAVKTPKVAVASDEILVDIEKGKFDFDILLATPDMMPKLAKVAKVLGPKGLMPSPKAGTIVADPKKALEEIGKGRVELRQDELGNIHVAVGKVSWPADKLKANIQAVLNSIQSNRVDRLTLSATMGPGVKVAKN